VQRSIWADAVLQLLNSSYLMPDSFKKSRIQAGSEHVLPLTVGQKMLSSRHPRFRFRPMAEGIVLSITTNLTEGGFPK